MPDINVPPVGVCLNPAAAHDDRADILLVTDQPKLVDWIVANFSDEIVQHIQRFGSFPGTHPEVETFWCDVAGSSPESDYQTNNEQAIGFHVIDDYEFCEGALGQFFEEIHTALGGEE